MSSNQMPNQPIMTRMKLSPSDANLWRLVGEDRSEEMRQMYWEIERERTERAKEWRRGRYKA